GLGRGLPRDCPRAAGYPRGIDDPLRASDRLRRPGLRRQSPARQTRAHREDRGVPQQLIRGRTRTDRGKRRRTERRTTMRVFVAGATGAIGRPLVAELVRQGHAVTGMTRSNASTQGLKELGAEVALVDALDAAAVEGAVRKSGAEAVIDQLTSLPRSPPDMPAARATDGRLRIEGGGTLRRAALACGVRRYIQQSSGFFLARGDGLADESVGMAVDASPGVASHARSYAELEARVL